LVKLRPEPEDSETLQPEGTGDRPRTSGAKARQAYFVVVPVLVLELLLWFAVFGVGHLFHEGPTGKGLATDFAVFSGAANALKHGQNPYDYRTLYRSERFLLARQRLPVTSNAFNVRAGNPPLFYWALEPLTAVPFQRIAWVWILAMYVCSAAGFVFALRYLGWTSWVFPTIVFLLLPETVTGALYGNVHGPVFAALSLSLLLVRRHPAVAGAVAALGWLKPQLALPLIFVIFVFHCPDRKRMLVGFLSVTAFLLGLTLLATGPHSLLEWLTGLNNWSKELNKQPNIASLSGLYALWAPRSVQIALTSILLAGAVAVTVVARRRWPIGIVPPSRSGWLWVLWFLVSGYTHYPDLIVLAVPVLALLGRDGSNVTRPRSIAVLYLSLFSLALFPSPLISLAVIAVGVILAWENWSRPSEAFGYQTI
jgi:Glycosyltransferase family 87